MQFEQGRVPANARYFHLPGGKSKRNRVKSSTLKEEFVKNLRDFVEQFCPPADVINTRIQLNIEHLEFKLHGKRVADIVFFVERDGISLVAYTKKAEAIELYCPHDSNDVVHADYVEKSDGAGRHMYG